MKSVFILFLLICHCRASSQTQFWEPTSGPQGGVVYAFTVSPEGGVFAGTLDGILYSTDKGRTWARTSNGLTNPYIRCLTSTPSGTIFAGTDYYSNGGLFRSTDNGMNWLRVDTGLPNYPIINDLAADSNGIVYAATYDGVFKTTTNGDTWFGVNGNMSETSIYSVTISSVGTLYIGTYSGVYSSTNSGANWFHTSPTTGYIIAVGTNSQNHVFAGGQTGLFRSTDRGNTWIQLTAGLTTNQIRDLSITTGDTIYLGTRAGAFRSTNDGDTWTGISDGLADTVLNCILGMGRNVIAGTGTTVFRSSNGGETWVRSDEGFVASRVTSLTASADGFLYAGTWNGVFRTSDKGGNWARVSEGLTNSGVRSTALDSRGHIYAATSGGVFRSTNRGNLWQQIFSGANAVAINPADHIFATTEYGAYRSTDDGITWSQSLTGTLYWDFTTIFIAPAGVIYAGVTDVISHNGTALFVSTNNGDTWTITPLQHISIGAIVVDNHGQVFAAAGNSVYRSTDGLTWTQFSLGGSLYSVISALTFNSRGHLFAGTLGTSGGSGAFRSTDNGETWGEINQGLDNKGIGSLAIDSSGFLFAGTYGNGMFRSIQSTTSVGQIRSEEPATLRLFQNYPNPWNPSTYIRYSLPRSAFVNITIYNVAGEEVAQLVNEVQGMGYHEVVFHGVGLASGVYFCRLHSEKYIETRKMLLLR